MPKFEKVDIKQIDAARPVKVMVVSEPLIPETPEYRELVREFSTNPGRVVGISRHAHHVLSDMVTHGYVMMEIRGKTFLYDSELNPVSEVLFNTLANFKSRQWVEFDKEILAWFVTDIGVAVIKQTGVS